MIFLMDSFFLAGASVDAYGTALYRVVDPKTSAYYLDPETNKADSERAAARVLRKALAAAVADVSASSLSSDLKTQVGAKVLESIKKREAELGLAFDLVEIRRRLVLGAWCLLMRFCSRRCLSCR